ncbi:cyclin-dependent kinase protein [Rutstroemia sp. NJR-2017a WRK4]|nr:cyclin-dependent kinase protein [Rutstroemia sp. NJR-2017a WRK4]
MTSPWKKQPEEVVGAVLKRAELSRMARKLQNRLALAQFKTDRGWEDLSLDTIEPRVEEELRRRRPTSSGDVLSDSSSSTTSEFAYPRGRTLLSSPLKAAAIFSDQIVSSGSSNGPRKRSYHSTFQPASSSSGSRKRVRSSPTPGRTIRQTDTWKGLHQLAQSSPIKPRKQPHFTTSAGPNISFYRGSSHMPDDLASPSFAAPSDDEDNHLPLHSFDMRPSSPRTPSPIRSRGNPLRRNKDGNGKPAEEEADLLLYLSSPANPASRARMQPPSTPPSKNLALPSSMMTTPGYSGSLSIFGAPATPSQAFDFADFVNITPSPAQTTWTPRAAKTPVTVARRRLTFENFHAPHGSPSMRDSPAKHTGLGMQLGGDLLP